MRLPEAIREKFRRAGAKGGAATKGIQSEARTTAAREAIRIRWSRVPRCQCERCAHRRALREAKRAS